MAPTNLSREMSQERLYSTLLVIGTLVISALLLHWHVEDTHKRFRENQQALMGQSTEGAASTISLVIESARRSVALIADKEADLIARLAENPEDDTAREAIKRDLRRYIPEHFAYTIADDSGEILLADFEGKIGDVCKADIRHFVSTREGQDVFIHPNPLGHHFDVMTPWSHAGRQGVFFVSFRPEVIARVLANSELHGHHLLLLNRDREGLIELTADGARDKIEREPFLSSDEFARIGYRVSIPGTNWELIDLPEEGLFAADLNEQRTRAVHIFLILLVFAGLMLWLIRREENLRSTAEQELMESHDLLERRVRERTQELSETNRRLATEADRRRRAQRRLSESESRYSLASQSSNEGIWEINFQHDESYFSPRSKLLLGLAVDGEAGLDDWLERLKEQDRLALEQALADARSGRTRDIDLDLHTRGTAGESRTLTCRGTVETGEDGQAIRIAGSMSESGNGSEGARRQGSGV